MTLLEQPSKQKFFSQLDAHFQEVMQQAPSLSKPARQKAWDHFVKLGLPHKKWEAFQYFPLTLFYDEVFKKPIRTVGLAANLPVSEYKGSLLVFLNGEFSKELSDTSALPKQVVILPLADAYQTYGSFLHSRLDKTLKIESNPFASLNLALETQGLFLFVPPKITMDVPIHCMHVITSERKEMFSPRIQVFVGNSSHVKWITTTHCLGETGYWLNGVIDVALEEGSSFELTGLIHSEEKAWHFDSVRATLKKDSRFELLEFASGGRALRQDLRVQLQGENATAKLQGVSLLKDQSQVHTNVFMGHESPHTHSSQLFKSILNDNAKSSFEGKIFVEKEAQKTEAYQSNHNLLLGHHAIAYSKPNLEIFADDVKASHGATISKLKEDQLFYLKTRGLSNDAAKELLILAFSQEITEQVPYPVIKKQMQNNTKQFLQ